MKIRMPAQKYVPILIGIVFLVSLILFLHFRNSNSYDANMALVDSIFEEEEIIDVEAKEESRVIMVDIKGAIQDPGVYEMQEGSRMYEVIELAGGLLQDADERQLNLAQLVNDEMMIYIPSEGEEGYIATQQGDDKVAINTADASSLEQLPGIGPAKAQAIITYRDEHGPFREIDDLLQVSGIGPKSLEHIREKISIR